MQSIKPTLSRELVLSLNEKLPSSQSYSNDSSRDFSSDYIDALSHQITQTPKQSSQTPKQSSQTPKQSSQTPKQSSQTPKQSSQEKNAVGPYKTAKKSDASRVAELLNNPARSKDQTKTVVKAQPPQKTFVHQSQPVERDQVITGDQQSKKIKSPKKTAAPSETKQPQMQSDTHDVIPPSHTQHRDEESHIKQNQETLEVSNIDYDESSSALNYDDEASITVTDLSFGNSKIFAEIYKNQEDISSNFVLQSSATFLSDDVEKSLDLLDGEGVTPEDDNADEMMIDSDFEALDESSSENLTADKANELESNPIQNISDDDFLNTLLSGLSTDKMRHENLKLSKVKNDMPNTDEMFSLNLLSKDLLFDNQEEVNDIDDDKPFRFITREQTEEELLMTENQAVFSSDHEATDQFILIDEARIDASDETNKTTINLTQFQMRFDSAISHEEYHDLKPAILNKELFLDEEVQNPEQPRLNLTTLDNVSNSLLQQVEPRDENDVALNAQLNEPMIKVQPLDRSTLPHLSHQAKLEPSVNIERALLQLDLEASDIQFSDTETELDSSSLNEEKFKLLRPDGFKVDKYKLNFHDKTYLKALLPGHFKLSEDASFIKKQLNQLDSTQKQDSNFTVEMSATKHSRYMLQITPNKSLIAHHAKPLQPSHSELVQALHDKFAPLMKKHILMMARHGVSSADIQLDPPELGAIHVRIQILGEQTQIHFNASNFQTREMIDQSMARLRDLLQQQGFSLQDESENHQRQDSHKHRKHKPSANLGEVNAEHHDLHSELVYQHRLVDFYA